MRSLSVSWGRWRIVKCNTWSSRSRAILHISTMCRPSLGFGNPLTTMYASPIVSTYVENTYRLHFFQFVLLWRMTNRRHQLKRTQKTTHRTINFLSLDRCLKTSIGKYHGHLLFVCATTVLQHTCSLYHCQCETCDFYNCFMIIFISPIKRQQTTYTHR